MSSIGKRLGALEDRVSPKKIVVIHRENPCEGITAADFPERYAAAQEAAGPTGTVIIVSYEEDWRAPEGGLIKMTWGED